MRRRTPTRRPEKAQPLGPVQQFEVDALTHEGKGVARLQGKVTFIAGALPGEIVEARVNKAGRRFDEAKLSSIIKESPYRTVPACEHYAVCGGCSFQHLAEPQQLEAKLSWLQGQVRKLVSDDALSVLSDQSTAYRRRARLSVLVKNGTLQLGFRGKSSNDIASIDHCLVLTKALQVIFTALKSSLSENALAPKLGHIELLEDSKGQAVTFRLTQTVDESLMSHWNEWARLQGVALYWQQPNMSRAQVSREAKRFYHIDGLTLGYHPQDFIQVNAAMNEKMVAQAMSWLNPSDQDVILDLFCGVGNFSLPLAKRAQEVIGVELQESMVEAGRANAQSNLIENVRFIAADLTKPVDQALSKMNINKVLLDPPRAGAFEFLDTIIKIAPKQILYVSCNASTLARDAEYLATKGYRVLRTGLMDMFPQTSHVETMMLLQKK